jgi:hypothetical protein
MPVVDLIIRAVNIDPALPYSQRRLRYRGGEVVDIRVDTGQNVLDGYGLIPLLSRRWRIVRVTDALDGDTGTLMSMGTVTPQQQGLGVTPRRRQWMIRLNDIPNSVKNQLIPRKYPDVDHAFFTSRPALRTALLNKFPGLATLPQNQRRSTLWDVSVTRSQIASFFLNKSSEGEDLSGFPTEPTIPDHQIDVGDNLL